MSTSKHKTAIGSTNRSFSTTDSPSLAARGEEFLGLTTEYSYSEPGNIIPHFWFRRIVDEKGRPDFTAITLLSEVFALYRFSNSSASCAYIVKRSCAETTLVGKVLRTSYEHFSEKFMIRKEKARRGFLRLEELGIIERGVCNISLEEGRRCNKLMITIDQEFFISCFRNPETDVRTPKGGLTSYLGDKEVKNTYSVGSNSENDANSSDSNKIQSIQISYHHIGNKNRNKKDRSSESNFCKNSTQQYEIPKIVKKNFLVQPKQLKDFYPLSQEDATILQSSCGREFSLNAMNEILKSMSKRLNDRLFKSKRAFLSYMSKAFQYEMRDAVKICNESFKIKANQTSEEIETKRQEEYLAEIEYSLQVSPEWHFKKKIAAILDRTKAYDFLKNYRSSAVEEGFFKIYLNKYIELSRMDRAVILQQVKATHESIELSTSESQTIETIEIIMPEKKSIAEQIEKTNNHLDNRQLQVTPALTGIWGNVRKILMSYYQEKGAALDRSWFSKLTAIEDAAGKSLTLTSPTRFICSYIQEHYQYLIKRFCEEEGYRLEIY